MAVNPRGSAGESSEQCLRCGLCDVVCPTALSPVTLADAERLGKNYVNATLCTSCGRCRLTCPAGVAPDSLAEHVKGTISSPEYDRVRQNVRKFGFVVEPEPSIPVQPPVIRKADVGYFNGCLTGLRLPEHAHAAKQILTRLGVEFTEIEENCCGSPLRRLGEYELAGELLSKNVRRFEKLGVKVVVTPCPGCATTLLEGNPGFDVYHCIEYFDELGIADMLEKTGETFSYHLPCHLYRNINPLSRQMTEKILNRIGNVSHLEHDSDCCGAGGLVHLQHPDESTDCAGHMAREFTESSASRLVTLCPSCYLQFRRLKLPVVDAAILFAGSMKSGDV